MPGLPRDFRARVRRALEDLFNEPSSITGTTERAVVGRLALHLERRFDGLPETHRAHPRVWDVEYMRASAMQKAFIPAGPAAAGAPAPTRRLLAPDLIWHRRLLGFPNVPAAAAADSNLAAIEVKLRASPSELLTDKAKLRLLVGAEPHIRRYTGDLRCTGDQRPGRQRYLGNVMMPPQPQGVSPRYEVGLSLNVFDHRAEVVEYRANQHVTNWQYP